jgi:hypothetical protein
MPQLRYTLSIEDYELVEMDFFQHTKDPTALVNELIVAPMKKRREALGEPPVSLTRVEVVNPHVHLHSWQRTHVSTFTSKACYRCQYCGITGYINYLIFEKREKCSSVTPDEPFLKEKFRLCRDELKPVPKKMIFR